jgi:hypothetical protein
MRQKLFFASVFFAWSLHAIVTGASVATIEVLTPAWSLAMIAFACGASARAWQAAGPATLPSDNAPWSRLTYALIAIAVAAHAAIILQAALLPTTAYDALGYRLPAVAQWLDAKRIVWVTSDDELRNGYPLGNEAITAVFAAFFDSFAHADLTAYLFFVPGLFGVATFAKAIGATREQAVLSAALYALVPMNLLNVGSGYVDAAFAGALAAAVGASALWLSEGPSPKNAFFFGATLALAACTKANGSVFALALAALALGARIVSGVRLTRKEILACVAGLLPGFFWVARNVAMTGDPIWPIDLAVGGHMLAQGMGPIDQVLDVAHNVPPELAKIPSPLRALIVWFELHGPARSFDDRFAGLGLAWLVAVVSIAWSTRAQWREKTVNCAYFLAFLAIAVWFIAQPERWWARYTIWLWILGAPCLAIFISHLRSLRRGALLTTALGLVITAEAGIAVTYAHDLPRLITERHLHAFSSQTPLAERFTLLAKLSPSMMRLELERESAVCRSAWKPGTDNANLDGYFAQLSPRVPVHVLEDKERPWREVASEARSMRCRALVLLRASPLVSEARSDSQATVTEETAFDPFYLVRLK